ncbi:carboxylesterase [Polyplosphaeria fusca]|uniref:Carboxylic ester hydrolase n=1 Tax=Polyplosphaeria fusca TaxID=682080 RepID=A0A9P4QU58_9PLEO|nr:carboxylesterase [Polyplosphaeria fusca]
MLHTTIQLTLLLAYSLAAAAVEPVVDLGYSRYRGRIVGDGTTQWLGIRYAAPPLGQLRFSAPQPPRNTSDIQDASKFGPICYPGNPDDWTMKPSTRFTVSEDCLYVNVFAPANATTKSRLPVMFFIQGGGYNSNSNANYNGSDLARVGNMIVVSMNYRVGAYGFLQSEEVVKDGALNAGLRDQIKALEWTRDNIEKFGGNSSHIVIDGDSAGAASVLIFLTSPYFLKNPLFVGAISESTYQNLYRTLPEGQEQYNCLLNATNCSNSTSTLSCLRSLNVSALQTPSCAFNPNFDSDLITQTPFSAFAQGTYLHIPTILGSCADEGTKNVPQTTPTLAAAHAFIRSKCPSLTNSSLPVLDTLYLNVSQPTFPDSGPLWRPLANALGDIGSHCVDRIYQNTLHADGVPSWSYNYAVRDPEQEAKGFGAYHTVELFAVWGPNNTDGHPPASYNASNAGIVPVAQAYWASFVRYLDPNVGRAGGAPVWEVWGEGRERLRFATNGTVVEGMEEAQDRRCGVVDPLVRALERIQPEGTRTELKLEG